MAYLILSDGTEIWLNLANLVTLAVNGAQIAAMDLRGEMIVYSVANIGNVVADVLAYYRKYNEPLRTPGKYPTPE